jgi:trehalose 6-phosphate phosphatase
VTAVPLTKIEPLRPLFTRSFLGLFSDIDGTLSPIVPRPEDASVTPRCRDLLRDLIRRGVRVALITGRELDVARAMVGVDEAAYAASHGLDFWVDGSSEMGVPVGEYAGLADRVVKEIGDLAEPGITIESKGAGVAFHYRRATDEAAALAAIQRAIVSTEAAQHFQRIEGRKVVELRPAVEANKGTAARRLADRLGVKSIICLGDDRTDVDMFQSVAALGKQGIEGRSVAVLSAEIHPDVLASADFTVDGVEGVEWLLAELADAVTRTAP